MSRELRADAAENLADYLLRNAPTTWNYTTVQELARKVAAAEDAPHEYKHFVVCNGDRRFPAGEPGHSCSCFNDYHTQKATKRAEDAPPAAKTDDDILREAGLDRAGWCDECICKISPSCPVHGFAAQPPQAPQEQVTAEMIRSAENDCYLFHRTLSAPEKDARMAKLLNVALAKPQEPGR